MRITARVAILCALSACSDPAQSARAPASPSVEREEPAPSDEPVAADPPADTPRGVTFDFDDVEGASAPAGWTVAHGSWAAREGALAQEASSRSAEFNVILSDADPVADLDVRVRLRALEGRIDRGGGLVWRARGPRDYYVARYNPLEDNLRAYTVREGRRVEIASADVELDHDGWHTLRVVMRGAHIEVQLDGQLLLEVDDETFASPGRIGLWTKADARTAFDDLEVAP